MKSARRGRGGIREGMNGNCTIIDAKCDHDLHCCPHCENVYCSKCKAEWVREVKASLYDAIGLEVYAGWWPEKECQHDSNIHNGNLS